MTDERDITASIEWYGPTVIDRERHGQRDSSAATGDCFRACMSVLLQVPNGDHLPHGIDQDDWWTDWWRFLLDLGLTIAHDNANGPIWKEQPWIASVPSLNHEGCTHAIVMHQGGDVLFDPSPLKRYEGNLLGEGVVIGGTWLEVADVRAFPWLIAFRAECNQPRIDHAVHACISCGPNPSTPGPGCINCRQTGYSQTPCPDCPGDSGSRKRQPNPSASGSYDS